MAEVNGSEAQILLSSNRTSEFAHLQNLIPEYLQQQLKSITDIELEMMIWMIKTRRNQAQVVQHNIARRSEQEKSQLQEKRLKMAAGCGEIISLGLLKTAYYSPSLLIFHLEVNCSYISFRREKWSNGSRV